MKDFYLYILKCSDGSYYTGHTDDIERRLCEHYRGEKCDYTARRRPVRLVWMDSFTDRGDAFEAERKIKKWNRKKKEALICGDWVALSKHAKKKFKKKKMIIK